MSRPAAARFSSSSSGTLLHRKRQARGELDVAHAIGCLRPDVRGSRSMRNRNSVLASTARTAISMPASKPPSARASW